MFVIAFGLVAPAPAWAQESCRRAVVFTLPGIIWEDVERVAPPALMGLVEDGSVGSIAVRTVAPRTSLGAAFATLGAGTRMRGGETTGGVADAAAIEGPLLTQVEVAGLQELVDLAEDDAYSAEPGALGSALAGEGIATIAVGNGDLGEQAAIHGYGRWTLLAAMNESGEVGLAYVAEDLLNEERTAPFGVRTDPVAIEAAVDEALAECGAVFVDHGDLARVETLTEGIDEPLAAQREAALLAADDLLAHVIEALDPERDLLLVLSPTSPEWDDDVHLGAAVAVGPNFRAGTTLESASTRQSGIVTLPDVAPTVLAHFGVARPATMTGRPWFPVEDSGDLVAGAVELDRESVFVSGLQGPVVTGFVVFQVLMYGSSVLLLRRSRRGAASRVAPGVRTLLELGALAVVAFPLATYLATPVRGHALGPFWFVVTLVGIDRKSVV